MKQFITVGNNYTLASAQTGDYIGITYVHPKLIYWKKIVVKISFSAKKF